MTVCPNEDQSYIIPLDYCSRWTLQRLRLKEAQSTTGYFRIKQKSYIFPIFWRYRNIVVCKDTKTTKSTRIKRPNVLKLKRCTWQHKDSTTDKVKVCQAIKDSLLWSLIVISRPHRSFRTSLLFVTSLKHSKETESSKSFRNSLTYIHSQWQWGPGNRQRSGKTQDFCL